MAVVRLEAIGKKYDSVVAIDELSLEVKSGEFVVLLGPSGCGKTSTLRCIAGLESPDSGNIYIDGARVNEIPPKDRDIAMVFQNYALYPHKSVYDNLAFPLRMRKVSREEIDSRVRETAELLNIEPHLKRKPKQLSGGEQQRVALGRAIIRKPKVFLMDEPLSNLDAKLRLTMRAELKRLQKEIGVTTIYVTHDQSEAIAIADRVAVLNRGRLLQYDRPSSVYHSPLTTFVAGFIGTPPMNLIHGQVVAKNGALAFEAPGLAFELPGKMADSHGEWPLEAYIGVRPEDLRVSPVKDVERAFESEVYIVEPVGAQNIVDLKVGISTILRSVVSESTSFELGQRVWCSFPADKVHIFDAKSQNSLPGSPG